MQRYFTRGLLAAAIMFLSANLLGRNEGKPLNSFKNGDVSLRIEQRSNRVSIYIVNATEEDIKINKLFRLSGTSAEIKFIVDGKAGVVARRESSGIVVLQDDISDPVLNLKPDNMYVSAFRLTDIASLFGLKKGDCKIFQAIYKDPLSLEGVYQGELVSNEERICINE